MTTFSFSSWNFYIKIFFGLRKSVCVCVCACVCTSVRCTYISFSYSFGSRYLCQQLLLFWGFCCNPSPWLLGPTWELLFPCLFLQALSQVLGYLKWEHSQSSGRNSSLNFPWPQLSSRQVASPPVKHEKEAFPGLFTSSTQGWKQLHSPAQLLRNQGDQVHSQGPPPPPTSSAPTFRALPASSRPQQLLCSGEAGGLSCK